MNEQPNQPMDVFIPILLATNHCALVDTLTAGWQRINIFQPTLLGLIGLMGFVGAVIWRFGQMDKTDHGKVTSMPQTSS